MSQTQSFIVLQSEPSVHGDDMHMPLEHSVPMSRASSEMPNLEGRPKFFSTTRT